LALLGKCGVDGEPLQANSSLSQEDENLQIVEGSKVTLQYVATVPGSTGIDYGNVSEFIQGRHEIFPALEQEVVGMKPGEEKKVELSPGEGFGPHDDRKKMNIPKTLLPFGTKAGDVLRNDVGELATVVQHRHDGCAGLTIRSREAASWKILKAEESVIEQFGQRGLPWYLFLTIVAAISLALLCIGYVGFGADEMKADQSVS
jgi:hypothetical protein